MKIKLYKVNKNLLTLYNTLMHSILPIPIRYDLDIKNIAFKYYHKVFMYLSKELRHNIDVVLAALKSNNQISVLMKTSNEIRKKLKKMDINIPNIAGSLCDTDTREY